jgi:hypothetical protein
MITRSTLSFIAKTQRTPDMTTVYDKLHAPCAPNKIRPRKDTAKELASIREELKNNMANVQEGITVAKRAEAAALKATTVGKAVAGMTRDIRNKAPQYQAGTPTSYAAVAAQGGLSASIYNTQSANTPPAQTQREIIVNVRNAQTTQSLRAMNPRNLKAHIERAIAQSEMST